MILGYKGSAAKPTTTAICKCDHCENEFSRYRSLADPYKHHYCGNKCKLAATRAPVETGTLGLTKECSRCGEDKPAESFTSRRDCAGGRQGVCRACVNARKRERRAERSTPRPRRTVPIGCTVCGATFVAKLSDGRKYCSRGCSAAAAKARGNARRKARRDEAVRHGKHCPSCETTKLASAFYPAASRADGLSYDCRACTRRRARLWFVSNPDQARRQGMRWKSSPANRRRIARLSRERYQRLSADPEWLERRRANGVRWRAENIEHVRARERRHYQENKDKYRAARLRWEKKNPHRAAAKKARRRSRELGAAGRYNSADVARLWYRQRGECARCGVRFGKRPADKGFHVDHVTPLSRGGSNWPRNLQLLCVSCNCQKNNRTPAEYTLYLRRIAEMG